MKKETDDWKPDYGITKGYPYDKPASEERFVVRLIPYIGSKGRVFINVDTKCYPDYKSPNWFQRTFVSKFTDFLMHRIYDYDQALLAAEAQIYEMQKDYPFVPEDFGFEKIYGPKTISDPPVSIYASKYNNNISIFRGKDDFWTMLTKKEEGFDSKTLKFPCHRIAYATFHALQVKVEGQQFKDTDNMKIFTASYLPENNPEIAIHLDGYHAIDEDDAKSRASFMITTMIDENVIVDPKFLEVKEKKPGDKDLKLIPDPKIVGYESASN